MGYIINKSVDSSFIIEKLAWIRFFNEPEENENGFFSFITRKAKQMLVRIYVFV